MPQVNLTKRVNIGGIELHLVEAGPSSGKPVLLLHGFPEYWWGWRNQIPALADAGFHVVAIDMRGYGQSDAPSDVGSYTLTTLTADIVSLAEKLGWHKFSVVGHDWGGIIAWALSARPPHLVETLAVLNAPHLDVLSNVLREKPSQILRSSYVGFFQMPWIPETALSAAGYALLRHALTSTARPGTFSQPELERYTTEWARPGRLKAMIHYYRALVQRPREPLGPVSVPTLILWGRQDLALDEDLARASLMQCEDGRIDFHDAATHWIHLEEPQWVNQKLLAIMCAD